MAAKQTKLQKECRTIMSRHSKFKLQRIQMDGTFEYHSELDEKIEVASTCWIFYPFSGPVMKSSDPELLDRFLTGTLEQGEYNKLLTSML